MDRNDGCNNNDNTCEEEQEQDVVALAYESKRWELAMAVMTSQEQNIVALAMILNLLKLGSTFFQKVSASSSTNSFLFHHPGVLLKHQNFEARLKACFHSHSF